MSILLSRRAYTSCPKNYPCLNKKSPKTISKKVIVPFALVYHLKNILIHSCISKKTPNRYFSKRSHPENYCEFTTN